MGRGDDRGSSNTFCMVRRLPLLLLVALLATAAAPGAAARPRAHVPVMFVANAEEGTVTMLDAGTFRAVRTINVIPEGSTPPPQQDPLQAAAYPALALLAGDNYAQDLDVSPDGRILYVARGHYGDMAAFDVESGELLWRVDVGGLRADHMTISEDGRRLYVSAIFENEVEVIDTKTREVIGSFRTGDWSHDNVLSRDGERIYNGSIGNIVLPWELRERRDESYQLTVADTETLEVKRTVEFRRGIRPFVLTSDERLMYAQLSEFHGLIEFDLDKGRILRRLRLPIDKGVTEDDYDFEAPHHGLALSREEKYLCVAGRASDYVAIVERASMHTVRIIKVDDGPGWAATSPDGRHCVVTSTRADTVSVISYDSLDKVEEIKVGKGPKHIVAAEVPNDVVEEEPN